MEKTIKKQLIILQNAFSLYFTEDQYEIKRNNYDVDCIIHYPEITITNEYNLNHTIKDLFVKISFVQGVIKTKIKGVRSTYSGIEYKKKYSHSHLTSIYTTPYFSDFCLGSSTIISNKIQEIFSKETDFNEEDIFSLICIIDQKYIRWESIKGRPYMYIKNINSGNNLNAVYNCHSYYLHTINSNLKFKINIVEKYGINVLEINKNDLEKKLYDYFKSDYYEENIFCEKNEITNTYYNINNDSDSDSELNIPDNELIIKFKEKEYFLKVKETTKQIKTNNYLNINLTNYIFEELNETINDKYFRKTITE